MKVQSVELKYFKKFRTPPVFDFTDPETGLAKSRNATDIEFAPTHPSKIPEETEFFTDIPGDAIFSSKNPVSASVKDARRNRVVLSCRIHQIQLCLPSPEARETLSLFLAP